MDRIIYTAMSCAKATLARQDALANNLRTAGIPCQIEVPLPSRFERPGDIGLPSFDPRGPLLVDLCGIHPLAPSRPRDPDIFF